MEKLRRIVEERRGTIGIIGLGHTGLYLANEFRQVNFKVIGFDIDAQKIKMLEQGEAYLPFFSPQALFASLNDKTFVPTTDENTLKAADVIIVSVPTPLTPQRTPDLSYLKKAVRTIAKVLHKDQLIIIQSTSFPGTTEEIILPMLEEGGLKVGKDFCLAYVPEREDAGNPTVILSQIPRIIGGVTPTCLELAELLYENITVKIHLCSSTRIAEATKTFENAYRLINIAFVDEMKITFDLMGINMWEVIEAASTKPFGFTTFFPGPGIGGECIPVDPLYLAWKAKEFSGPTTMIETASHINIKTSSYVVQKVIDALNHHKKSLNGAKILILGVAFKRDVSDVRESPALRIIPPLQKQGATVHYNDPLVPRLPPLGMESIPLEEERMHEFDCVVILTDHHHYDWNWICKHSQLIVDTRNATSGVPHREKKVTL